MHFNCFNLLSVIEHALEVFLLKLPVIELIYTNGCPNEPTNADCLAYES